MPALTGLRILVVENDEMNALLIGMQLQQAGAAVIGPASGVADALRLIDASAPQAAVLDYRLGNGETSEPIARQLREQRIPFVLATGVGADSVPATFHAGEILTKPYLAEDLVQSLDQAKRKVANG